MRGELKVFEEDIPDNLTEEQERQLIDLQLKAGAIDAQIVERNGNRFLRYTFKAFS